MDEWMTDAACRDDTVDRDVFFPTADRHDNSRFNQDVRDAKAACLRCPVRRDCLDYAVRLGIPHGIYGGLLPAERPKPAARKRPRRQLDEVVVERAVTGKPVDRPLTTDEVQAAGVEYMRRTGLSVHVAATHLHVGPHRLTRLVREAS
jgi:WhiB family redox-sensing transcriptional regulator